MINGMVVIKINFIEGKPQIQNSLLNPWLVNSASNFF
jgi:hypothetical protein